MNQGRIFSGERYKVGGRGAGVLRPANFVCIDRQIHAPTISRERERERLVGRGRQLEEKTENRK
jgi:hypothetical protein